MSEVKSPLGQQSFGGGASRVLTVDDPTQGAHPVYNERELPSQMDSMARSLTSEERKELQQRRQEAQQQVNPMVKNRVEYLCEIGRITDVMEAEDGQGKAVKFHLRSLRSRELLEVHDTMVQMGKATETRVNFELRRQLLSRSLWAIDNILIEDIINSNDLADKLEFIEDLDENLVNSLQKFYENNIMRKGKEQFAVKNPEEMEQVAEDIKKS